MRRDEIAALLPGLFQRTLQPNTPLIALLEVMEAMHVPCEAALDTLPSFFHPMHAPERFVSFLARWVDLDIPVTSGMGRLRELVAAGLQLSRWRGTARGLLQFLRAATGEAGISIEEQVMGVEGRPLLFHIRVKAPGTLAPHRAMLEAIIEREKPAHVTHELAFDQPVLEAR